MQKIKLNFFLLFIILCLSFNKVVGQKANPKTKSTTSTTKEKENKGGIGRQKAGTKKRKTAAYWLIGIGGNVVDDDGSPFKHLFNALPRWNVRPYPTRITIEKSLKSSFNIEAALNFNVYKPGKIINNHDNAVSGVFASVDVNLKNSFNRMAGVNHRFDPYVVYGLGATIRTVRSVPVGSNINTGLGFNIWLSHVIGLNFQSIAKFGISSHFLRSNSNYLQHSAGLVLKLIKGKRAFAKRRYKWIRKNNNGGKERTW